MTTNKGINGLLTLFVAVCAQTVPCRTDLTLSPQTQEASMFRRIERASAMLANHMSRGVALATIAFLGGILLPFTQARAEPVTNWYSLDEPGDHIWGTCQEALPNIARLAEVDTCKDAVLDQLNITESEAYSLPVYTTRFTITLSEEQVAQKIAELQQAPLVQPGKEPANEVPATDNQRPTSLMTSSEDLKQGADGVWEGWLWFLSLVAGVAVLTATIVAILFFTRWRMPTPVRPIEVRLELVIAEERAKNATREQRTLPVILKKTDDGDGAYRLSSRVEGLPTVFVGYSPRALREEVRRNMKTINESRGIVVVFPPTDRTESLFEGGGKLPRLDQIFTTEQPASAP